MTDEILIAHLAAPLDAAVHVPPSKSLTNRALALAALATGTSRIESPLLAQDTLRMARALTFMGVRIDGYGPFGEAFAEALGADPHRSVPGMFLGDGGRGGNDASGEAGGLEVEGRGGRFTRPAGPIDVGGSGTAMRFLTGLAALADGDVVIDGDARMRQRPIGPLIDALARLGVDVVSIESAGTPPVRVRGGALEGGSTRIAGNVSSQFVSALLMIAPLGRVATSITVEPPIVSRPYIDLTLDLMARFGIRPITVGSAGWAGSAPGVSDPERNHDQRRSVPAGLSRERADSSRYGEDPTLPGSLRIVLSPSPAGYTRADYTVPPDASSASYMFAAAALTGGRVKVRGLRRADAQPDAVLPGYLAGMGCGVEDDVDGTTVVGPARGGLRPFDLDLVDAPDLAPTLAVMSMFANGPSRLRNVANLRVKESDRLHGLATELRRMGAEVQEHADGLAIAPGVHVPARIETYADHRIAMAFAIAGLVVPGVRIADPGCVAKSFPGFWKTLASLTRR